MRFLAQLLADLTRKPRTRVIRGVDFEWSKASWVHNAFRTYELLFWRRSGIRVESSSWMRDGTEYHASHTWENAFAFIETQIRKFRVPFRVWIPVLVTPQGMPVLSSPYIFAIAFDAVTQQYGGGSTTDRSVSHTATGSNLIAWTGGNTHTVGTATMTATYAGSSSTVISDSPSVNGGANDVSSWLFWIVSPTTGVQTAHVLCSSTNDMDIAVTSYSGASQTGVPDAHSKTENTVPTTSTVLTVTTSADNCWLVGIFRDEIGGGSAGANTTLRYDNSDGAFADTNSAQTPAGSKSMSRTFGLAQNDGVIASFAPSGAAAANTVIPRRRLMGIGQ